MKSYRIYLALVLLLSILPIVSIFLNPNLPHTSDGGVHLPRIGAFYKALGDGHFPVRWAADINYGYGLPLFNFIYHLPYFVASFFVFIGTSLVLSFKLTLLISYFFSGIFMFLLSREILKKDDQAFLVTVLYQFSPFRLVEILVRGSIGEIYVYTFLPLVLYGLTKLSKKISTGNIILTSTATALLVLSHNSLSAVFFGVCIVYALFVLPRSNRLFYISSLLLGLALSAYYWIPAIMEHKFTHGDVYMKDLYKQHFPLFINFFVPNLFDAARFRVAEISVFIGIFQALSLVTSTLVLVTKKALSPQIRKLFIVSLLLTIVSFAFMQPISLVVWENVRFLRQFQFPWRLLGVLSITTAFCSISLFSFSFFQKKYIYWTIVILTIASTFYFWMPPQGYDSVRESDFWNYPLNTTYYGETDVIWSGGEAKKYARSQIELIGGTATITNVVKKTVLHEFDVKAQNEVQIVDNTTYFPGWRVYSNSKKIPVEFQDINWRGLITFRLPKGSHHIKVVFEESPIRYLADSISLCSMFIIGFIYIISKLRRSL